VIYNHTLIQSSSGIHEWLKHHTWIVWYVRDAHGDLRLLWDGRTTNQHLRQPKSRYPHMRDRDNSYTSTDFHPFGCPQHEQLLSSLASDFTRTLPEYPYGVRIATADSLGPDTNYLQFFTWSASFTLQSSSPLPHKPPRKHRRFGIFDINMDWCRTIVLDQSWFFKSQTQQQTERITIQPDEHVLNSRMERKEKRKDGSTLWSETQLDENQDSYGELHYFSPYQDSATVMATTSPQYLGGTTSYLGAQVNVDQISATGTHAPSEEPQAQEEAETTPIVRATYEFLALSEAVLFQGRVPFLELLRPQRTMGIRDRMGLV
jgi:hypothetical protein